MKVVISGASGLIGRALVKELRSAGHVVKVLVRRPPSDEQEAFWDPQKGIPNPEVLQGADAVIHLGGRPIATRWTRKVKEEIRTSRVESTRFLVDSLRTLSPPPRVFLCASAIGFYGNRGDEILTEDSAPGSGFLAETCQDWEAAARKAEAFGTRVVCLRFGQVLSAEGGVLGRLLPVFRAGLGGPIGDGRSWWSWILRRDAVRAISFLLTHEALFGPVNITAPQPVPNAVFARTLARALRRPAIFPVPAFVLKILFGEMAEEVLLASSRVQPEKLLRAGFEFEFPELESAIREALRNSG